MELTIEQAKYTLAKLQEAMTTNPTDFHTWIICYQEVTELIDMLEQTEHGVENLGGEELDEYVSTIHWMKDHWPLGDDTEPETLEMISEQV